MRRSPQSSNPSGSTKLIVTGSAGFSQPNNANESVSTVIADTIRGDDRSKFRIRILMPTPIRSFVRLMQKTPEFTSFNSLIHTDRTAAACSEPAALHPLLLFGLRG